MQRNICVCNSYAFNGPRHWPGSCSPFTHTLSLSLCISLTHTCTHTYIHTHRSSARNRSHGPGGHGMSIHFLCVMKINHSRRRSDLECLDLQISQFSWEILWVTRTPFIHVKTCLKIWGLPRKCVWYVRGLPWKLVGNFGSRNYFQSDFPRPVGGTGLERFLYYQRMLTYLAQCQELLDLCAQLGQTLAGSVRCTTKLWSARQCSGGKRRRRRRRGTGGGAERVENGWKSFFLTGIIIIWIFVCLDDRPLFSPCGGSLWVTSILLQTLLVWTPGTHVQSMKCLLVWAAWWIKRIWPVCLNKVVSYLHLSHPCRLSFLIFLFLYFYFSLPHSPSLLLSLFRFFCCTRARSLRFACVPLSILSYRIWDRARAQALSADRPSQAMQIKAAAPQRIFSYCRTKCLLYSMWHVTPCFVLAFERNTSWELKVAHMHENNKFESKST